jgi:type II secretory pathway component PulM
MKPLAQLLLPVTAKYEALAPRERTFVLVGCIAAAVLIVGGGLIKLHSAAIAVDKRVAAKRETLSWMQSVAPRIQAMPAPAAGDESLALLVDRTARESGLGAALTGAEPSGDTALRVRVEGASFDVLVAWLARIQQEHGLTVESADMIATATTGAVNASIVLQRR